MQGNVSVIIQPPCYFVHCHPREDKSNVNNFLVFNDRKSPLEKIVENMSTR